MAKFDFYAQIVTLLVKSVFILSVACPLPKQRDSAAQNSAGKVCLSLLCYPSKYKHIVIIQYPQISSVPIHVIPYSIYPGYQRSTRSLSRQPAGQSLAKLCCPLVLPAFGRPSGWGACRPLAPRYIQSRTLKSKVLVFYTEKRR